MGAAWPHKLVFRVKRRLKSIFSCNQKTAIKRKHKTATQHSGRDLERRSKGAGRWRYFVPQAQNNAGTKRTLLRRDKMLQYRYFKFSIGYLEDRPLLCTSVLPQAKPRRRDGFAIPSISMPKGEAGRRHAESTKKDTTYVVSFFVEQVRGIEPPCSAWEADILPLNYTCNLIA